MNREAKESGLPGVAVVIPTVGRPTLAASVLAALTDDGVAEIAVVADRQVDDVRDGLAEIAGDPRLRIVAGPGRGPGWARQLGVEASTAPVVLFLDDDVLPAPGLASAHARHHVDRDDLVVVGYMPVGERYRRMAATARVYGNDYLAACAAFERDPSRVCTNLWAGNVSLSRAGVEKVPLAVADSPASRREDQAFGLRCVRAGLTGVFDRSLESEHRFERPLKEFLAISREQVRELSNLREQYPELSLQDAGVSPGEHPWSWVLTMSQVRVVAPAVRGAVRVGVFLARLAGARRLEDHGVALLRALVQQQTCAQLG